MAAVGMLDERLRDELTTQRTLVEQLNVALDHHTAQLAAAAAREPTDAALGGLQDVLNSQTDTVQTLTGLLREQAEKLAQKLRQDIEIEKVSIIDRDKGLKQFMQISGFGDAIKFLDENPLPHVITVQPLVDQQRPDQVIHLVDALQEEALVELAQLDMQWVKRLYTLLDVAQRGVWIIGSLLGLAVLLIVGNTIRLDIQNRREAIEVSKLIGASNAFIRRPFLYTGLWYGLSGGLLAWLLIAVSLGIMEDPIQKLAALYHSSYEISGFSSVNITALIVISCLLGLGGSWLAVGRHLSDIEPS